MRVNFTIDWWDIASLGFVIVCALLAWIVATDKSQEWPHARRSGVVAMFVFFGTMVACATVMQR